MSLFNWLSRDRQAKAPADSGSASRPETVRGGLERPAQHSRKSERSARRELLYSVVRESMARAGVLSASYKFKVLSLDAAGRQFLVMIDLASSERIDGDLMTDIEAVVVQRAKSRHELLVSAVYWRRTDEIGVRRPVSRQQARSAATAAPPSQPAELLTGPASLPLAASAAPAAASGIDPIQEEELEALRAALAGGARGAAAEAGAPSRTPTRPNARGADAVPTPPPGGFQDTRVDDDARRRTLSPTQSGDLN